MVLVLLAPVPTSAPALPFRFRRAQTHLPQLRVTLQQRLVLLLVPEPAVLIVLLNDGTSVREMLSVQRLVVLLEVPLVQDTAGVRVERRSDGEELRGRRG